MQVEMFGGEAVWTFDAALKWIRFSVLRTDGLYIDLILEPGRCLAAIPPRELAGALMDGRTRIISGIYPGEATPRAIDQSEVGKAQVTFSRNCEVRLQISTIHGWQEIQNAHLSRRD